MAALCEFESLEAGTECRRGCGRRLAFMFASHPIADCKAVCANLGEPTGELIQISYARRCGGATERTSKSFAVHACAALGQCLPGYRCDPSAVELSSGAVPPACRGCASFSLSK